MSSHWILENYKLQMFYRVFFSSHNTSCPLSVALFRPFSYLLSWHTKVFTHSHLPQTNVYNRDRERERHTHTHTHTHTLHTLILCHHGTIWHCHHLVIKPLLALNMKSWQELMMMILAVAQPRFPTNRPDIRQETYCPVVVLVWPCV